MSTCTYFLKTTHRSAAAVLVALPLSVHAAVCSMDVDANGKIEATTDGLLMMRYMLGIRGTALTSGALGSGAARTAPTEIETHLATPCLQAGWVAQGTGRLNDTGVTFGGEATSGNNAGCTGADIAQQDCSKGRDVNPALNGATDGAVGFSFTKISNSGNPLPVSAALGTGPNDWACTYDNVTGLMWEVKTVNGRRSQDHSYTWYSSDPRYNAGAMGTANGGTCGDPGQCDTEKYVQITNATSPALCGRTDWRMPHAKELESIANFNGVTPAIDAAWFPNTPASIFWSGLPDAGGVAFAWIVDFGSGIAYSDFRSTGYRVRLVRAGR